MIDAFRIAGVDVHVETDDRALRALVLTHWKPFAVAASRNRRPHAVFRFTDRGGPALPRLKQWAGFSNDHVIFLTDGKRYLLTGYCYDHPWQFDCRSLPAWDADFVYYYVFEPVLLDVLKRCGVLAWHCAAVERGGFAALLPGVSGSGKSTTTLNLLSCGFRFIADDAAFLRVKGQALEVLGLDTSVYVTDRTLRLLPEWRPSVTAGRHRKGRQWKYQVDLSDRRSKRRTPAVAKYLLFPKVSGGTATRLEKLKPADALLECLKQTPKEFPSSVLGPAAVEAQFEIYSLLVRSATTYRVHLGSDQVGVRAALSRLQ
ncbi:MAG: hypothetical protein IPL75_20555 [Acidobacteria bacterium]|nr:hypothetical protein [Acidobacteriota bacterium]